MAPSVVLDRLSGFDPTPAKLYLEWLVTRLTSRASEWADLPNLSHHDGRSYLEIFVAVKNQLPNKDIGSYKSWSDLGAKLREFLHESTVGAGMGADSDEVQQQLASGDTTVHVDNAHWTVLSPLTEEASKFWGRNTRWCTSWEKDNRFAYYTEKEYPDSLLYILFDKQGSTNNRPGERWQIHVPSTQFFNEDDQPTTDAFSDPHLFEAIRSIPYDEATDPDTNSTLYSEILKNNLSFAFLFDYVQTTLSAGESLDAELVPAEYQNLRLDSQLTDNPWLAAFAAICSVDSAKIPPHAFVFAANRCATVDIAYLTTYLTTLKTISVLNFSSLLTELRTLPPQLLPVIAPNWESTRWSVQTALLTKPGFATPESIAHVGALMSSDDAISESFRRLSPPAIVVLAAVVPNYVEKLRQLLPTSDHVNDLRHSLSWGIPHHRVDAASTAITALVPKADLGELLVLFDGWPNKLDQKISADRLELLITATAKSDKCVSLLAWLIVGHSQAAIAYLAKPHAVVGLVDFAIHDSDKYATDPDKIANSNRIFQALVIAAATMHSHVAEFEDAETALQIPGIVLSHLHYVATWGKDALKPLKKKLLWCRKHYKLSPAQFWTLSASVLLRSPASVAEIANFAGKFVVDASASLAGFTKTRRWRDADFVKFWELLDFPPVEQLTSRQRVTIYNLLHKNFPDFAAGMVATSIDIDRVSSGDGDDSGESDYFAESDPDDYGGVDLTPHYAAVEGAGNYIKKLCDDISPKILPRLLSRGSSNVDGSVAYLMRTCDDTQFLEFLRCYTLFHYDPQTKQNFEWENEGFGYNRNLFDELEDRGLLTPQVAQSILFAATGAPPRQWWQFEAAAFKWWLSDTPKIPIKTALRIDFDTPQSLEIPALTQWVASVSFDTFQGNNRAVLHHIFGDFGNTKLFSKAMLFLLDFDVHYRGRPVAELPSVAKQKFFRVQYLLTKHFLQKLLKKPVPATFRDVLRHAPVWVHPDQLELPL